MRNDPALAGARDHEALRAELLPLLQRCDWFTIGVMAPSAEAAVAAGDADADTDTGGTVWAFAQTPGAPLPALVARKMLASPAR